MSQPHWACPRSRRVCFPCLHCLGPRLLCRKLSEAGPGLYALPRSKLLRFRYLGSPQRNRLSWACILYPSQVCAAQVTRCLVSAAAPRWWLQLITSPVPAAQFSGCRTGAPSQVPAAPVTRCLASTVSATYRLPHPCHSVFWVYNWHAFSGGCRPSRIPRSLG